MDSFEKVILFKDIEEEKIYLLDIDPGVYCHIQP